MHGRLDLDELLPIYRSYRDLPMVSISNDQRRPLPGMNWVGTVYHGLPRDLLKFTARSAGYLAFLGRLSPEKRPELAIESHDAQACRLKWLLKSIVPIASSEISPAQTPELKEQWTKSAKRRRPV